MSLRTPVDWSTAARTVNEGAAMAPTPIAVPDNDSLMGSSPPTLQVVEMPASSNAVPALQLDAIRNMPTHRANPYPVPSDYGQSVALRPRSSSMPRTSAPPGDQLYRQEPHLLADDAAREVRPNRAITRTIRAILQEDNAVDRLNC